MQQTIRQTRFPGLGYAKIGNDWRVIDTSSQNPKLSDAVGQFYKTKTELLCDIDRVAQEWGY